MLYSLMPEGALVSQQFEEDLLHSLMKPEGVWVGWQFEEEP
jgi:hypothetical protein